jgi:hypothetical protein
MNCFLFSSLKVKALICIGTNCSFHGQYSCLMLRAEDNQPISQKSYQSPSVALSPQKQKSGKQKAFSYSPTSKKSIFLSRGHIYQL